MTVYLTSETNNHERRVDGASRDEICTIYQRKILLLARRLAERLPSSCALSVDDLVSYGAIGLLEAFERYDDQRNIQFTTFAEYRIRGAMMDALRANDTFSRHRRQRSREYQDIQHTMTMVLGRPPSHPEMAAHLDMDMDSYWRSQEHLIPVSHVRLEDTDGPDGESEGRTYAEAIQGTDGQQPVRALVWEDARRELKEAIQALPERKRQCVLLYYGRDLTLAEIAAVFNVTPSRISQVLTEARNDLRRKLHGRVTTKDLELMEAQ